MIFLADESVEFSVIHAFREMGYDVFSISESSPSIPDNEVLKIAYDQK